MILLFVRLQCSSGRRHDSVVSVMFNPIHSVGDSVIRSRNHVHKLIGILWSHLGAIGCIVLSILIIHVL